MKKAAAVLIYLLFSASLAYADDIKVKPLSFFANPDPYCEAGISVSGRTFYETKGIGSYNVTVRVYRADVLTGTYSLGNFYGESPVWVGYFIDTTIPCSIPGVYTVKISFRTTRDGVTKDLYTKIRVK